MQSNDLSDHPNIGQLLREWARAIREKDVDRVGDCVASDAEFWSNDAPALQGRDAVRAAFGVFFEQYDMDQEFELLELIVRGDVAIARGIEHNHLVPAEGGEPVEQTQRAVSIMARQEDGTWVFARGMTNLPPRSEARHDPF